jgi:inner membrane protein
MTGATHVVIAVSCGIMAGCSNIELALIAGGALVPDLDHPRSTIGRIFFPVSIPLSEWLGHRGPFHSFWLWGLLILAGLIWNPFLFIGVGAILHIFADCYTVSGVRAMAPWTNKLFVFLKRSWRLKTGGSAEFAVLVVFGTLAWAGGQVGSMGGISAVLGYLTGSPQIMLEEYKLKGLQKCFVDGTLRWNNGKIEEGRWLIIGSEGKSGLALQAVGGNKLIHLPDHGRFIRARLKPTEERWEAVKLKGWGVTENPCYFMDSGKWYYAEVGDVIWGQVIGDGFVINSME